MGLVEAEGAKREGDTIMGPLCSSGCSSQDGGGGGWAAKQSFTLPFHNCVWASVPESRRREIKLNDEELSSRLMTRTGRYLNLSTAALFVIYNQWKEAVFGFWHSGCEHLRTICTVMHIRLLNWSSLHCTGVHVTQSKSSFLHQTTNHVSALIHWSWVIWTKPFIRL